MEESGDVNKVVEMKTKVPVFQKRLALIDSSKQGEKCEVYLCN